MNAFDQEVQLLDEQYENGEISSQEYNTALNELSRGYQEAREESAQKAYDDEFEQW